MCIRDRGFQKIRGMYLLGNVLALHLVQDVLERRNVVVVPQGVDTEMCIRDRG